MANNDTYQGVQYTAAKEPIRQFEVTPFPARAQAKMDALEHRLAHLEAIVHRYINREDDGK